MSKFPVLIIGISLILSILLSVSCTRSDSDTINEKVGSQLLTQVNLRLEQIDNPTTERLEIMKNMGMRVDNLEIQRIFIHLSQKLNTSQIEELEAMGIILYTDSWIPPVGAHPTGFILADMPVEVLGELADKEYIVNLDTAEVELQPQSGN